MLKAKIKEKLLNRRNEVDVDEIRDSNGNIIDVEGLINIPVIKEGFYITDENDNLKWVEELPEDYNGHFVQIALNNADTITIGFYEDGEWEFYISLNVGSESVEVVQGSNRTALSAYGVDKINAQSGTPVTVYGEDSDGNLVKGSISGGTQLYKHTIEFGNSDLLYFYSLSSTQLTTITDIVNAYSFVINAFINYDGEPEFANVLYLGFGSDVQHLKIVYYSNANTGISTLTEDNSFTDTVTTL